jgi:hypothetical protein
VVSGAAVNPKPQSLLAMLVVIWIGDAAPLYLRPLSLGTMFSLGICWSSKVQIGVKSDPLSCGAAMAARQIRPLDVRR